MRKQLTMITASILFGAVVLGGEVSLNESSVALDRYSYLSDLFSRITWDEEFLGGKRLSVKSLAHIAALDTTCEMRVKSPVADVEVEERDYYKPPFGRVLRRSEMAQIGDRFKALARIAPTYYADGETWLFSNWFFNPFGDNIKQLLLPFVTLCDVDNSVTWDCSQFALSGTEIVWGNFAPASSDLGTRILASQIANKMNGLTGAESVKISTIGSAISIPSAVMESSIMPKYYAWDGFPIQSPLLESAAWITARHDTCLWRAESKAFEVTYRKKSEGFSVSFDWEKIITAVNDYMNANGSIDQSEWTDALEVSDCVTVAVDPSEDTTETDTGNNMLATYSNHAYYTPPSFSHTGSTTINCGEMTSEQINSKKVYVKTATVWGPSGDWLGGKLYSLSFRPLAEIPTTGVGSASWFSSSQAPEAICPSSVANETKFMTDYKDLTQVASGCGFAIFDIVENGVTKRKYKNTNYAGNNALLNELYDVGNNWYGDVLGNMFSIPFGAEYNLPPRPSYSTSVTLDMRSFGNGAEETVYWFESDNDFWSGWVYRVAGAENDVPEHVVCCDDVPEITMENATLNITWESDFDDWENRSCSVISTVLPYGTLRVNMGLLKVD